MPKYCVSGDLQVAFVIDVEADNAEDAEALVAKMTYDEIEAQGNTDTLTAGVIVDGCEETDDFEDDEEPDFEYHPGVDGPRDD